MPHRIPPVGPRPTLLALVSTALVACTGDAGREPPASPVPGAGRPEAAAPIDRMEVATALSDGSNPEAPTPGTPMEPAAGRPVERPVERPNEESSERPTERLTERPIERAVERSTEQPAEQPTEERREPKSTVPPEEPLADTEEAPGNEPAPAGRPDAAGDGRTDPGPPTVRDSRFGGGRLRDLAARHGLHVGIAPRQARDLDFESIPEAELYRSILAEEFDIVTPENSQKMGWLRPTPDAWDWEATDRLVAFAEAHDQLVRGHPLVWHDQNPDWLDDIAPERIPALMREHVALAMARHRGRVAVWDVVNEAFRPDGGFRYSAWNPKGRGDYIAEAFRAARAADPVAELIINDFKIASPSAKSEGLLAFIEQALADGVPIDGVGVQMHIPTATGHFDAIRENFRRFAELGLSIWITEMDVTTDWREDPDVEAERQAVVYENVVRLCVEQPACRAIQIWGLSDRYAWRGTLDALPLDEHFQPKPAWYAIQRALGDSPPTPRR